MRIQPVLPLCVLLGACTSSDPLAVFDEVYSPEKLPSVTFSIDNTRDTTITGAQGTMLRIPAGTFVDSIGAAVEHVDLELKEALDPLSMVMGNLTTTSGGAPLQTGGMLWLGAQSKGGSVYFAPGKSISAAVPCDSVQAGMMLYKGNEGKQGVDWTEPEPMVAIEMDKLEDPRAEPGALQADTIVAQVETNVSFNIGEDRVVEGYPAFVDSFITAISFANDGLWISKDSTVFFRGYQINLYYNDSAVSTSTGYATMRSGDFLVHNTRALKKGQNLYLEDPNTHYLFDIKQLGWANIDRLYQDPRTQEVDFVTNVSGADDYPSLYVTLLIKEARMYLPGYRRKDGSFGFSHGDEEAMQLPVGAQVIVMATAYTEDVPHFAMSKLVLGPNNRVELSPLVTSMEKLKADLSAAI